MSNFHSILGHTEYENDIVSTSTSNSHPRYGNVPFDLIELSIETLLGTSYEVRLSGRTTIAFLKSKLQRSEGIPKHHLHLIHRGKFCVHSSRYTYSKIKLSAYSQCVVIFLLTYKQEESFQIPCRWKNVGLKMLLHLS